MSNAGIGPFRLSTIYILFVTGWRQTSREGVPWDSQTIEFADADFSLFHCYAREMYGEHFFLLKKLRLYIDNTLVTRSTFKHKLVVFLVHVSHV